MLPKFEIVSSLLGTHYFSQTSAHEHQNCLYSLSTLPTMWFRGYMLPTININDMKLKLLTR